MLNFKLSVDSKLQSLRKKQEVDELRMSKSRRSLSRNRKLMNETGEKSDRTLGQDSTFERLYELGKSKQLNRSHSHNLV